MGIDIRVVTNESRPQIIAFSLRLCKRAQWEIREMGRLILAEVLEVAEALFTLAGPSCITSGKCREVHSCGKPYANMRELISGESDRS